MTAALILFQPFKIYILRLHDVSPSYPLAKRLAAYYRFIRRNVAGMPCSPAITSRFFNGEMILLCEYTPRLLLADDFRFALYLS